jgi:hypothetical protein
MQLKKIIEFFFTRILLGFTFSFEAFFDLVDFGNDREIRTALLTGDF